MVSNYEPLCISHSLYYSPITMWYDLRYQMVLKELIWNANIAKLIWPVSRKPPFFLVHLHLILLRPDAIFPGSQTVIHDEFWQVVPATPAGGGSKAGHNAQSGEALNPTEKSQSSFPVFVWHSFKKKQLRRNCYIL